ncbi:MAG TPA: sigma-70 family RNA polymerase sigma factor, partial [Ktedonobacteraceae bacterium]|nr:sigma-70 family RNA polymerase sigma factor [Ktedonobacteraceae bacterium]
MVKKLRSNNQEVDPPKQHGRGAYEALLNNLDGRLEAARPRLVCYARKRGITPDAVDDVVQETLLEAWNSFSRLYAPESFDSWLNGICRNLCRRWVETHSQNLRRQETGLFQEADDPEASLLENIVDPLALDPVELLSHQELATLLAQALGYLPETTRSTLELCYLEELSQSEAALQLGLSTNALGVRLHRARRQLRQILNTKLRAEAQEFGLALDEEVTGTWRETRIWCMFCSRCHMQGLFEPFPDGRVNLRLRCPICSPNFGSPEHDYALTYSGRMLELQGLRSFRPAFNRVTQVADTYWRSM